MEDQQDYQDNVLLVHSIANKCHRRLKAAGVTMDYEDIFQELSFVYIKAKQYYNVQNGAKFSSYFVTAAYNHFNKIGEKLIAEKIDFGVTSESDFSNDLKEEFNILEMIASEDQTPEERCMAIERAKKAIDSVGDLSPLARQMILWLIDTPDSIKEEFSKYRSHSEHAINLGYTKRSHSFIGINFLGLFVQNLGVNKIEVQEAKKEIKAFIDKL